MAIRALLAAAVLATGYLPVLGDRAASCSHAEEIAGLCSEVAGGAVQVVGWETIAGTGGDSASTLPPRWFDWAAIYACRVGASYDACVRDVAPLITIRDIASFVPTPGRQQMQPDGWTVVGLDTNFYAITEQHVVAGTLLGRPADVRFTPTAFHWDYGDGSTATKPTKGGTWEVLEVDEFAPTPTSHVYEQLGDYTITLSITFSAEYRFDGSAWRAVVGTITLPANDLYLRVGTAKTVLVEHDCDANPSGPGC